MSFTDELLANNARYAETFSGPLPLPPSRQLAVVACMDARLNVYAILGLNDGEAHVIRNAGGVDDAADHPHLVPPGPHPGDPRAGPLPPPLIGGRPGLLQDRRSLATDLPAPARTPGPTGARASPGRTTAT
nr:hypothetical protein [Streptomyces spinosus]